MKILPLALLSLCAALAACDGGVGEFKADAAVKTDLEKVGSYRIFFGHQSVGENIVAGLEDIKKASGVDGFAVMRYKAGMPMPQAFFAHAHVGENYHPQTKFDQFCRFVDDDLAGKLDIALVKLCFVDVDRRTDVKQVFDAYEKTIAGLRAAHPHVVFIPVTVPLMTQDGNSKIKYLIKTVMGTQNDNVNRNAFNALLRKAHAGEPIFDLAEAESTWPDGRREAYGKDASQFALIHAYSKDGGHLNDFGRQWVARRLLSLLAAVPLQRDTTQAATATAAVH